MSTEQPDESGGSEPLEVSSRPEDLVALVYEDLRRRAANLLRRRNRTQTLQPTALVNEAYIRLAKARDLQCKSRTHFLAIAANAMRWILAEHARKPQPVRLTIAEPDLPSGDHGSGATSFLRLHAAIEKLAALNERHARIVELRFFAGLKVQDIAELLAVSKSTVEKDWTMARAWLGNELRTEDDHGPG